MWDYGIAVAVVVVILSPSLPPSLVVVVVGTIFHVSTPVGDGFTERLCRAATSRQELPLTEPVVEQKFVVWFPLPRFPLHAHAVFTCLPVVPTFPVTQGFPSLSHL